MRLDVIGSSPAWPNAGGACSGYLIDGRLLLDAGPGVLAKLRARGAWPEVEAIAITHLHLDHWGDLIPWVWGTLFGPGKDAPRVELRLPPGALDALRPTLALLGSEDMLERAFSVSEYEPGTPFSAAGLRVTALPVVHYDMEAFGFRVEGEQVLGYSGDSGPCEALGELAREVDLFVCEATLASGGLEGPTRGHLDPAEAQAAAAGARRVLFTHRPQELEPPPGELARDGLVVDF